MSILKFLSKKKPAPADARKTRRQELETFLWGCERMFFDNDRYLLTNAQKIHLVHILADMCRETETNPDRLCIYQFFHSLYRFPRLEYENYLKGTDVAAILQSTESLPTQAKHALVLVLYTMLHVDGNASEKNTSLVSGIFHAMGVGDAECRKIIATYPNLLSK